jgi:anti-sigma regulatory factor (Ser/Thr protein kinase)
MTFEAVDCVHDVLLFGSDDELVAATTPFVLDGVAAGDFVIVYGGDRHVAVLRDAFDDPRVHFDTGTDIYRSATSAIAEYQRICERENSAGRRVRATGPLSFGDNPVIRAQWMQYEALVNRALRPYRFFGLCRYDTRTTPPELLDIAFQTHHHVVTTEGTFHNDGKRTEDQLLRDLAPTDEPDPLETTPPVLAIDDISAPGPVRHEVLRALLSGGVPLVRADGFVTAISEVVTNAVQHGRPQVIVRLYGDRHRWLCAVTDDGPGISDPYTGIDSPFVGNPDRNGMGLWVARQLCDQLTITTGPTGGATVRVSVSIDR